MGYGVWGKGQQGVKAKGDRMHPFYLIQLTTHHIPHNPLYELYKLPFMASDFFGKKDGSAERYIYKVSQINEG